MNKRITAEDFYNAIERQFSDLKPDPWLAQRIIASEKGEAKVKKKLSVSVIVALLLLALATVALAVTGLYRVINWQGDVTRTIEFSQKSNSEIVQSVPEEWYMESMESLNSFISEIPDEETTFAWYNNDDGSIKCSKLHKKHSIQGSIKILPEGLEVI